MKPACALQDHRPIETFRLCVCKDGVCSIVENLRSADAHAFRDEIKSEASLREGDVIDVDAVPADFGLGSETENVLRKNADEGTRRAELGKRDRDVCLRAAEGRIERRKLKHRAARGRRQPQHHFAKTNDATGIGRHDTLAFLGSSNL